MWPATTPRCSTTPRPPEQWPGLGGYARYETPLPSRIKALAVLTAAREACGHYVWTVNQNAAKDAGLSDDIIAAIREYRAPAGFDADDATVVQFVLELLRQHRISDATFEAMRALVGNAGAIDTLIVSGYYHTLAHCLQALEVELPEGTDHCADVLAALLDGAGAGWYPAPCVLGLYHFDSCKNSFLYLMDMKSEKSSDFQDLYQLWGSPSSPGKQAYLPILQ